MIFINGTETIGLIMAAGVTGITGDMVAILFLILLTLMAFCMMFAIPFEFVAVLVLPFCIACAAFYSNFLVPVVIILMYVSMLIAKNWLFK